MTSFDLADLLPAEQRLLDAAKVGEPCNLIDPDARPTHAEITEWNDSDREISAEFLARLITNRYPEVRLERVELRGAIICGHLELTGPIDIIDFQSEYCRYQEVTLQDATFTGSASFHGSTFTGAALWGDSTFAGEALFSGATFARYTGFLGSTFDGDAWFSGATFARYAGFGKATFTGEAWFSNVTFDGDAWFDGATFARYAGFGEATFAAGARFSGTKFAGRASFTQAVFNGETSFNQATFAGEALFLLSQFTGDAWFDKATFSEESWFGESTFTGSAFFSEVTFTNKARFDGAKFGDLLLSETVIGEGFFRRTTFKGLVHGAWAARTVTFNAARFMEPVTIQLLCPNVSLTNIELQSRGTLQLRGVVDGTAATFGGRTTLSDPGIEAWDEWLRRPQVKLRDGEWVPHEERTQLAAQLLPLLEPGFCSTVSSLRRATVADLELSAVDLSDCRFAGAHGLDKMRIDSVCKLPGTQTDAAFGGPLRFTRRTVIAEEGLWRQKHVKWDRGQGAAEPSPPAAEHGADAQQGSATEGAVLEAEHEPSTDGTVPEAEHEPPADETMLKGDPDRGAAEKDDVDDPPDAATIAGIYRALRKGLEDAGNEPGAADFYYGEMEMRRLTRREWSKKRKDNAERTVSATPKPSRAETALLTAYWAVSGYGLRAWRAFAAIVVLILVGSLVFWTVGVQDPPGSTSQVSKVDLGTGQVEYQPSELAQVAMVNPGTGQVEYVPVPTFQVDKVDVGTGAVEYTKVPLPAFTWPDSLEFAARSSVALLRAPAGAPKLTGIGTVTDIALRLLVPVLLALAVLAIRGRTKR